MKRSKLSNTIATSEKNNKKLSDEKQHVDSQLVYLGEYFNVHSMKSHPLTTTFVKREAQRLYDWANLDESLLLQDFIATGGYSHVIFHEWLKKFPELAAAHEYAKMKIGSRREIGAIYRKFDASTIHRTLGHYNEIWREQTRELAKLKEETSVNETKIVVIEKFPDPISIRTPEEVAMEIHKSTQDSRKIGSHEYKNREE